MEVTSPITKHSVGKTFLISLGVVGFIALLELGAVAWAFIARFQSSLPPASASVASEPPDSTLPSNPPAGPSSSTSSQKLVLDDPLAATPEAQATPTPEPVLPKPTPLPLARAEQPPSQNRAIELVDQARALRERGDTLTALTRLREAQAVAPDHPQIISEMAITYEKMGQAEKAAEQWQRIYKMGESAGIYFAAAEAKLKNATITQQSPSPDPGAAGAALANSTPVTQDPAIPKDTAGFQPGSTLAFAEMVREDANDPSALTRFTLKVPVKSRPGSKLDVHDVVIQVFFYDLLDNQSVVQTNANVNSHWTTPPTDWADDNMEILEIDYSLPRPDVRDTTRPVENRKFYGYVARIYYKKQLQDMRADPVRLLQQFPPPVTLQTNDSH